MVWPFGFFGYPGWMEILILAFIVLLLFGNRLPSVMGSLGKSIVEFKKGLAGIDDDGKKPSKQVEDAGNKKKQ
jgi:sec-independent protein translocase protein TatA